MCIHYNGFRKVFVIWPAVMGCIMFLESTCLAEATHRERVSCLSLDHELFGLEIEPQIKPWKLHRSTVRFLLAADGILACHSLIHFSSLSLCRIGKHAIMCNKGKLSITSAKMCFILQWQLLFYTWVSPFLISFSTSRILLVTWLEWMREISYSDVISNIFAWLKPCLMGLRAVETIGNQWNYGLTMTIEMTCKEDVLDLLTETRWLLVQQLYFMPSWRKFGLFMGSWNT